MNNVDTSQEPAGKDCTKNLTYSNTSVMIMAAFKFRPQLYGRCRVTSAAHGGHST